MNKNEILLKEIIDTNQNVQDALILLKIWLTQKNIVVSIYLFINLIKFIKYNIFFLFSGNWKYYELYFIHVCGIFI